ncbi:beta-ketoacyl-[acyl-carrier-protein] synthase family protein [Aestuariirhabdus sp. Z084]|uniref:beta-ketoacyl-[acyl-carrier-protein] synthase family protein n=1 Tax=Aestuariirhabdus haliotis TaxID=2918751 RepID=UPI00201B40D2|nr:beta-ketoacyl-[acyl-carrier-protein] synthase family protein [Aestuariirhabdus haliotis]MCL6415855.1 beta-ketoacyl-[acyl-carrier-protein] synthase family protein [Aestuariirhabdus haliotis]MCL6419843.1 beta-ketoacyl-[acyl-carrier-protein] synthase family protein [Aestuariirhabdus haliotis]
MHPIQITAYTASNAAGVGINSILASLKAEKSGLAPNDFNPLATYIGRVRELDTYQLEAQYQDLDCRNNRLADLCLRQDGFASRVAALRERCGSTRIGLFLGTSTSGIFDLEQAYHHSDAGVQLDFDVSYMGTVSNYSLVEFVARCLGLDGPQFCVSTACSSSAKVFVMAQRMIEAGLIDGAVVGGVDSLCNSTLYGFNSLALLSEQLCRPSGQGRDGINIGEGGGFMLLERNNAEDADALCLLGTGESSDAHHISSPHPQGDGAVVCMTQAIARAGLQASDVDYVNLHGTATPVNDAVEALAVSRVFECVPACSSTKGWTGHTLGAAGITEAVICALTIEHELLPGTLNRGVVDAELPISLLHKTRSGSPQRALTNSFGFGGNNCSLLIGRAL